MSTTVLRVLRADGQLQAVSVYALGVLNGYPVRLKAAHETPRYLLPHE